VAGRQHDRLARHAAVELEEGDDRAGKGDGADGNAEAHLDQRLAVDGADGTDAEAFGRIDGGGGDHDGGQTDEAVEGGDQLRHRGHGDAARGDRADAAADDEAEHDQAEAAGEGLASASVVTMAMRHADHAVGVALAGWWSDATGPQRQDEQDAGDEIEEGGKVQGHVTSPSSCTSPACAG
jgi:hypothetical protein